MKGALQRMALAVPLLGPVFARRALISVRLRARLRRLLKLARPAAVQVQQADALHLAPVFVATDRREFLQASAQAPGREVAGTCEAIARAHPSGSFHLRRFCLCCGETTRMRMDYRSAQADAAGRLVPNWREGLVCRGCGMNNRQRLVARLVRQATAGCERPRIYLMEEVTPIVEWVRHLPGADVEGSEYLGPGYQGGQRVRGARHEDVMKLSWPDASFDLVVSNDVMEHIPDPAAALRECHRVLRPGGTMLATFPFHPGSEATVVRARVVDGGVEHLLPAAYHGNPLSPDGSLVFRDFGWDLLDDMRAAGFSPVACEAYASDEFGHLGAGLLVFRLTRPPRPAAPR